jgi:hypothetical protein
VAYPCFAVCRPFRRIAAIIQWNNNLDLFGFLCYNKIMNNGEEDHSFSGRKQCVNCLRFEDLRLLRYGKALIPVHKINWVKIIGITGTNGEGKRFPTGSHLCLDCMFCFEAVE